MDVKSKVEDTLHHDPVITYEDFSKIIDWRDPVGCIFGNYDYAALCTPRWPFCRSYLGNRFASRPPVFYPVTEPLPWVLALLMGFQHAVAMVGGIIVPPIIISSTQKDPTIRSYLVAASLITSGMGSVIQCMRFKIPGTKYFYGTGLITVVGTGIQQVQVVVAALKIQTAEGVDWGEAYGKLLGTLAVCSVTVLCISFFPPPVMKRIFPPWIAGLCVFVGGVNLIGVGIGDWGGGLGCSSPPSLCSGNGDVVLPFGNAWYLCIGAAVFFSIILMEIWGSPFLRNIQIMMGFLLGYAFSAIITRDGQSFINYAAIRASPTWQFLWLKTFKLGFYPAAVLPLIIAFAVDAANTVGDITASEEASGLATFGSEHDAHIQGGLLADGFNSMFSALATVTPVLVYAQNNGVISFTMVASRIAGTFCGIWLIVMGIFGKFGAILANAPNPVLGGMQVVIFSTVATAGLRLMNMTNFNRRIRFIQVMAGGIGLGATLIPAWGTNDFWVVSQGSSGVVKALHDSVELILGTGFALAFLLAVILHNILPEEDDPKALRDAMLMNATAYGANALGDELDDVDDLKESVVEKDAMAAPELTPMHLN